MHQIAYFESPKYKNSLVWEGEYPLPHPPSPVIPPPINFGIDNIPTNLPKVCIRSHTLSPQNAKTPWVRGKGDTPSHTLPQISTGSVSPPPKFWTFCVITMFTFNHEWISLFEFGIMYQITYFESPECKNSVMCVEGGYPPPTPSPAWSASSLVGHPPLKEDTYSVNMYFPINFGIDNISTNSAKVCTKMLTLNPQNAKTLFWIKYTNKHTKC